MEIKDPAFNYDALGQVYSAYRRTDPRIEAYVQKALVSAGTVLNVGAGSGSYEPQDKYVVAVEPSKVMRAQRLPGKVPALIGKADALPFDDKSFDASMAMITLHHWPDIEKGLKELRRVTKDQVVLLTCDPEALPNFWNTNYFPELVEIERIRFPKIEMLTGILGANCEIINIPIPIDCVDGFQEAFYARPEAFLNKEVRQSQSAWGFLPEGLEEVLVNRLADDLSSGEWDRKFGAHRTLPYFNGSLTLIVSRP